MKALLIAICCILLVACQTTKLVPVYVMPTAPVELTKPLPDLQTIKKPDAK